ncbi:hypothetical protein AQUCO_00500505v1 [Aquilegia coerulea]|uniref:Zinc knuckle CX2CX4HX4C domain-containing protein n=1 Tax=Aquilegia coerulea TaxID=218851 RepID=A0A2G5ES91_AQUCA|nr:hypothetical protein AQUCO_00500505v1 [Aquilegia coerulea]
MVVDGIFTITFKTGMDYLFVLENDPWDIHGYIISFKQRHQDLALEDFEFQLFPMWIQVFGLPLERHSKENLQMIGRIFGKVLMVDSVGSAEGRVPYARIQVMYDLTKPIRKDAQVRVSAGKKVLVIFKYERLPLFCYFCGMLGHDCGVQQGFVQGGV